MIDAMLQEVDARLRLSPNLLSAARTRQKRVQAVAASFTGWLRNYEAGSLAHGTPIFTPIFTADADCGMVLDRRSYPRLGPDGEGEGPSAILEDVRTRLRKALRPGYPSIRFRITKRAIKITFHDPLADGSDPTVDLIVALTRKDAEGLWIPNTEQERWDPSHPERHTELLADPSDPLREARALAIRLAKGENVSYRDPALCSFNIEALALDAVTEAVGTGRSLVSFFDYAARDLARRLTPDPAGVSPPIKLLKDRETAVKRLERAGGIIRPVLNSNDECEIRNALNKLWPDHIEACEPEGGWDSELRKSRPLVDASGLALPGPAAVRERQRPVRSYGDATFGRSLRRVARW